ncbi:MAG: 4Fe-4S binding protein [Candidatus Omnitrophica bacterium]|nr:4Fe-4S binding protein [Candidatus Omnitrophota bacterium]
MAKRKMIKIDEDKCNGCALCIPNCPEGALRIIDGKARLISDLFCDGLGACIGHCPQGAITIEEREAEKYDERKVMKNIVKHGKNVIKAHLEHLKEHGESGYLKEAMEFLKEKRINIPIEDVSHNHEQAAGAKCISGLRNWPVQINLIPPSAPYLNNADLLVAADCVPFAYADFHQELLKGKVLLVGCPKLDDAEVYKEKIGRIVKNNNIKSITYAHMEVPCCFGMVPIIKEAIAGSGKDIPFKTVVIGIKGDRLK